VLLIIQQQRDAQLLLPDYCWAGLLALGIVAAGMPSRGKISSTINSNNNNNHHLSQAEKRKSTTNRHKFYCVVDPGWSQLTIARLERDSLAIPSRVELLFLTSQPFCVCKLNPKAI